MVVRIRLNYRRVPRKRVVRNRDLAGVAASLMAPVSLTAWALAGWRILADLKIAGEFAFSDGFLSRWQVWVAVGLAVQFAAYLLHRASRRDDFDGGVS